MIIANPIYDSVFKYLLEDLEIARELLATILSEDIDYIEVKPQETTTKLSSSTINILRLDFKAVIKKANGEQYKVLIELQKAKHLLDIMRFRRYLGENYLKEDTVLTDNGVTESKPLPIVTIYFLGFAMAKGYPSVFKLNHRLVDVVSGEEIINRPKEPFVDLLNHESYTIQIPLLEDVLQTPIERVLMIFDQKNLTDDKHKLNYQSETSDPLVKKILNRLTRAAADQELLRTMEVEDEVENTIAKLLREKDNIIEDLKTYIASLEERLKDK